MTTVTGTLPALRGYTPVKLYLQVEGQTTYLNASGHAVDSFTGNVLTVTVVEAMPAAFYVAEVRDIVTISGQPTEVGIWDGFAIQEGNAWKLLEARPGSNTPAVTLQLGATIPLTLGQVTGLTQDLVVGNSYTQELGTRIPVTLTDTSGNAVDTTFGDRSLSDANCTIKCVLHPMNARNTDNVTAAAQGDCEFVPASGSDPASLWIELPKAQTDKLSPGMYSIQFHAIWDDGETVTIAWKGQCRFVRIIRPKN